MVPMAPLSPSWPALRSFVCPSFRPLVLPVSFRRSPCHFPCLEASILPSVRPLCNPPWDDWERSPKSHPAFLALLNLSHWNWQLGGSYCIPLLHLTSVSCLIRKITPFSDYVLPFILVVVGLDPNLFDFSARARSSTLLSSVLPLLL